MRIVKGFGFFSFIRRSMRSSPLIMWIMLHTSKKIMWLSIMFMFRKFVAARMSSLIIYIGVEAD